MADASDFSNIPRIDSGEPSSSIERCEQRYNIFKKFIKSEGKCIAELGVFKGDLIHYMLRFKPSQLFLVDPWFMFAEKWHFAQSTTTPPDTTDALIAILSQYRAEIARKQVVPFIGTSRTFLNAIGDNALDFAYIDSTHTYDGTVEELELLHRKVRPGGFVAGDDYNKSPDSPHHGVYRAVWDVARSGKYQVVNDGEANQFVLQNRKGIFV